MVQEPYVEPPPERIDIVRGTNYLLESLGIDHRIRSISEFASPVLIPVYEKICSCQLNDVRLPVHNLADEIHNIQSVINALCFDTVEFDLSHISGEQVANGDLYAMEDLLEILTDVYHWIKNDRQENDEIAAYPGRTYIPPLNSDRSSVQASSLGAQIAQLADRRRAFGHDMAAPNSLVYTEISPIVSPSSSPSRRHPKENVEHDTVVEDLQEKYQALLRRFEQTVHISSDPLNLSRISEDAPSTTTPDLRLLLDDLTNYNNGKKQDNYHKETRTVSNKKEYDDIEDDLALILNDKKLQQRIKPIESIEDHETIKSNTQDSIISATTTTIGRNRLNHSDEFYQIRNQLQEQYHVKHNLNHFLERHFNDDLDDYKSTKTLLQNDKERHAMQHHDIDTSTLRINEHQSRVRRSHSASSKIREGALRKGFLCASTNALNVRPLVHKHDFNDPETTIDNEITTNVKTTNKHRLLLGNENDLIQVLNEQFPGIYVSTEMQAKLNDQFSKHIDSVFKSRVELLNSQQGNLNDLEKVKQKHDQMTEILRKEIGAVQRQQDIQLKQSAERILKSKIRDQRIQQARVRRYFQEYCLDQRKRLLKKRTNEELILKQAYKDSIRIQRERLQEMKKYKQEYNALFLSRYRNQLESLENYYRQRLDMFKEVEQKESALQRTNDREDKLELNKQRLQLRKKLETDIKQLQDQLNQNDDYIHFRQLDLERLKENLTQARITTKV
ncbi:unnamed protein product [Rotaria socialis]|uniref:DUF5745 domain-containing protein n=1 Tax=Rotaria socialis TaxID=392032 RepID=A0A820K211_9BILA|nr:unnamed protein product [Rotaria socialis]CAF3187984.1 unnamed protein product [Rotaria socialis]CAF3364766.1 unnamed protein product [Rotaria socialis]CAF3385391.1 unnamed protein product [Rotaria socialis]CAF4210383.1 unnamed protein product [Rotaria socialis]